MRSTLPVALVLVGAGCGSVPATAPSSDAEAQPVVNAARQAYRPGEVATLVLDNPLDERVGYNACTWTLELHRDDGWAPAPHEDERVCTMELHTLAAGDTAHTEFALDERLPDGRYRLRATLHRLDAGSRETYRSGTFRIRR